MTSEPPRPAPPAPEALAQALAFLLKAMEDNVPAGGDEDGQDIESNITHLDRLAWRRQVAGEALRRAAQTEAALFRRRRNALLPIHRLPRELLSAIIIESVDENQVYRTKALQLLARVAWQWWQIIKSNTRFWAHITPPMGGVELQIRKAGILPLRMVWPTRVDAKDRDAFKDLLQRHAERWTSLDLKGNRCEDVALQALCTTPFPRLNYLKVRGTSRGISGDRNFNLANFQNLQEAHLPIVPHFSVSPPPTSPLLLQALHLDLRSRRSHASSDLEFLESLLRCIPQLIDLEVNNLDNHEDTPSPVDAPIINLPMLRRLWFSNVTSGDRREGIPFLVQIRAPLLEDLSLLYLRNIESWSPTITIDGRTIFDELVMQPRTSLGRPEDAPLYSVLRNAGTETSWTVNVSRGDVWIAAKGSGNAEVEIHCWTKDDPPTEILLSLTTLTLPVDLEMVWWDEDTKPAVWDDLLDATPLLRSFTLDCPLQVAHQIMDRLSTKAPSPGSASPRAPLLEKVHFRQEFSNGPDWSKDDVGEAVQTMLESRHNLFIQGGVLDPPKLVVAEPRGTVFDEVEGRWVKSDDA